MRVVTWNMNAAFRGDQHSSTWAWLIESLQPDLVLAQEAIKPDNLAGCGALIGEAGSKYGWGSWVVAGNDGLTLEPVGRVPLGGYVAPPALADSHPGSCAVTTVTLDGDGETLMAVSLYGLMDNTGEGRTRHATTSLHRMLSDLMPIFESGVPIILGGDLNITNQPMKGDSGGWWHAQDLALFHRLDALGMVSATGRPNFDHGDGALGCTCAAGEACRHVRTIRHHNNPDSTPYQDDWLYVSKSIEHNVTGGRVVHDEAAWERSDHCPLVLEINL